MVNASQADQVSKLSKRSNNYTAFVILGLCILFVAAAFLLFKTNSLYTFGLFGRGEMCGGWNIGGEVVCSCRGKLVKPDCPAGAMCDAVDYTCYGQCGSCCFKGSVEQSWYPYCSDSPISNGNSSPTPGPKILPSARDFCDFDTSEKVESVQDCGDYLVLSRGCCDIPDTIVDRSGAVLATCGGFAGYSQECEQRFPAKNCTVISCKDRLGENN